MIGNIALLMKKFDKSLGGTGSALQVTPYLR